MIQPRAGQYLEARSKRSALWIIGSIHQPSHTCLNHRPGAHRAWFQRNVEDRIRHPVISQHARPLAQHYYFRMCRRVAVANRPVSRSRQYPFFANQYRPDRHFSCLRRSACLFQRHLHELDIRGHQAREYHATEGNFACPAALPPTAGVARILDNLARAQQTDDMKQLVERLFQLDFFKGMGVTFRTQNPKNIYTEQYPLERPLVAERYRGAPRLNDNPETGETLCIACNLCALACPENLIVVGWERDDATRRKVLTTFTYDTSRCMFCGLCEDACPTDALELTQDFEMAYYTREGAIWDRHRLEEGPTPTRYTR